MLASLLGRRKPITANDLPVAAEPVAEEKATSTLSVAVPVESETKLIDLKVRVHQRLIDELNLPLIERMQRHEIEPQVGPIIRDMLKQETAVKLSADDSKRFVSDVLDELLGFGALEPLLKDATVNDIIVNTSQQVCVERGGKIEVTGVHFKDDAHLLRIINKMVAEVGRRIDESSPIVDARLRDGSRINAVIPPVAVDGPLLSIRKFAKVPFDLGRLVATGSVTSDMKLVLEAMVMGKLNVLISGGTGSGKTTLLNAMSKSISHSEPSSPSRMRPSCSYSSPWCDGWKPARRASRASSRSRSANSSRQPSGCGQTVSSWARCVAVKPSTCFRR